MSLDLVAAGPSHDPQAQASAPAVLLVLPARARRSRPRPCPPSAFFPAVPDRVGGKPNFLEGVRSLTGEGLQTRRRPLPIRAPPAASFRLPS